MKIFVFGAGASHASQGTDSVPVRAPLMNDIFDEKYLACATQYELTASDFQRFRSEISEVGGDFEEWLTIWWEKIPSYTTEARRTSERVKLGQVGYYLYELFSKVSESAGLNLYGELIDTLLERDVEFGFISFNYDLLLDVAYTRARIDPALNRLDNYALNRYIKPHGSINWWVPARPGELLSTPEDHRVNQKESIRQGVRLFFKNIPIDTAKVKVIDPENVRARSLGEMFPPTGSHYYPLIHLPLTGKMYDHFVGFHENVISEAALLCAQATEICIVGYRARDAIVKDIFANIRANTILTVVDQDKDSADKIMAKIREWQPLFESGATVYLGFADYLAQLRGGAARAP